MNLKQLSCLTRSIERKIRLF